MRLWKLVCFLVLSMGDELEKEATVSRTTMFEDVRPQKRLTGFKIDTISFKSTSPGRCSQFCVGQESCLSFNYCGKRLCQLNSQDANAPGMKLMDDSSCTFFGMNNWYEPSCGSNLESCQIDSKVFGNLGEWERLVEIDNATEYKTIDSRRCEAAVPDGRQVCEGGYASETTVKEWLKFHRDQKTWDDAKLFCQQFERGRLFYRVDGTWEQLNFFLERVDDFWLGIYTKDAKRPDPEWRSVDETVIDSDLLLWLPGTAEPNNRGKTIPCQVFKLR